MAKETFYFSHDYNARTDVKIKKLILKLGLKGYGIFWSIIEDLYNNANALPEDYESISYDLREDESIIKSVINDFDLFIIEDNIISSESVERRLILRDAKTDSARKAALARWEKEREKKRLKNATAMQTHNECNANEMQNLCDSNAIKESKAKQIKEEESIVKQSKKIDVPCYSDLQKECKDKIERYESTFLIEDLQNFIEHFKSVNIKEQEIKDAMKDFKLNKINNDTPAAPYTYKNYKEWFKKYITDFRAKYIHVPKFRVTFIDESVERLDLHAAFDFYWQEEYTIEFIRAKIYSGEYPPKNNLNFKALIDDKLIETEND